VLNALSHALHRLDPRLIEKDSYLENGNAGIFVVATSLNSPWTVLLSLVGIPERVFKACKALIINLVFYEQEKRRREGMAVQELAKAHQLHLTNLREAIAIARDLDLANVSMSDVKDLFEATSPLHRSPARLLGANDER
jgi:hypothetical protein